MSRYLKRHMGKGNGISWCNGNLKNLKGPSDTVQLKRSINKRYLMSQIYA